jgi:uncharacterized protein (TIGR03435 family)
MHGLSYGRDVVLAIATAAIATAVIATAQPQPASFAAASIKPAVVAIGREGGNRSRIQHTPTSLTMSNVTLADCVEWAYGLAPFQLPGARPGSDSYDILAKTDAPVEVGQLKAMLQDLLAKRFQLAIHRESKLLPVYELVVAKGGPKLPKANVPSDGPVHTADSLPRVENGAFVFANASLPEFAEMLAKLRGIDLPVVDRTGIAGNFDMVLKSAPAAAREADTAALFALVQEQLGLKLVSAKAPFEIVIIDHAGKPSAN